MKQMNGTTYANTAVAEQHNLSRMPAELQSKLAHIYQELVFQERHLETTKLYCGDARELLPLIIPNTIDLSVWSPPYFVGKEYEIDLTFDDWQALLEEVIALHFSIIKPGGFLAINIADILVFRDSTMPKIQAEVVSRRKIPINRNDVLSSMEKYPNYNRYQLAELLGCSEQTIDRRLNGNNIRGGKYETQTRVKIVGGLVEGWALNAGFYPYDRRVWVKDAAWENSKWASLSYRSVDEFEYIYIFWKPGVTKIDRKRLSQKEWRDWGSRGVWSFPSVRTNDDHEAKFPIELPRRLIKMLTEPGDIVLDCFMGSGTTAIAAIREKRQYLGIDLLEKYIKLAKQNIEAELRQYANQSK